MTGKEDDMKRKAEAFHIDFVFVSETWARPGSRNEMCIHWSPAEIRQLVGHTPYGTGLYVGARVCKD